MQNRNEEIRNIRPEIKKATTDKSGAVESFQNATLRPILKFQHELIMSLLDGEKTFELAVVNTGDKDQFRNEVSIWLQKQPKIKNQLLGFVLALFTSDEMASYQLHKPEYNRRIIQMLIQRITDTKG